MKPQLFMLPEASIPVPSSLSRLRRFPLDGKLLLFDRNTGLNALCEGEETAALRQRAPRVVQFGITNRCNLACGFCSRELAADSLWTVDSAFTMLAALAEHGVLEVAFGGGEPWAFFGLAGLVRRLHEETPLAVNLTTNGLLLTPARLSAIEGAYGQIRLSLYEDNDWPARVAMLVAAGARFGVNWLLTPARLDALEPTVLRLFSRADCGAGRDFIVLTSDQKLLPCSFHHLAIAVRDADEVMEVWRTRQSELQLAARDPGCARAPGFGLFALTELPHP
jgi:MoaA/NifB/PqqE/SkfB family radical SAM enzyme